METRGRLTSAEKGTALRWLPAEPWSVGSIRTRIRMKWPVEGGAVAPSGSTAIKRGFRHPLPGAEEEIPLGGSSWPVPPTGRPSRFLDRGGISLPVATSAPPPAPRHLVSRPQRTKTPSVTVA